MHHIPHMLVRGQVWCQALWPLMTPFQIRVIYWKYLLCIVCNLIIRFSPNILTESWKRCIR